MVVVSGGHTNLYLVPREGEYALLGRTRDDAAGEAYDKVARLLGLGYPGGPIIDRLAADGNPRAIAWPGTRLTNPDRNAPERDGRFDFSFSGLKTAVLRYVRARQSDLGVATLPDAEVRDIAASFQRRVVDTLVERTFAAARWHGARAVAIAGGVSANASLRREVNARGAALESADGTALAVPANCGGTFLSQEDFNLAVETIRRRPATAGMVFNLASAYVAWEEVARMVVEVTGSSAPVEVVPAKEWKGAAFLADRWELDDRRVRAELGFRPCRDESGVRATLRQAIGATWGRLQAHES